MKDRLESHRSFGSVGLSLSVFSYLSAVLCLIGCVMVAMSDHAADDLMPARNYAGTAVGLLFTGCIFGMRSGAIFCIDCVRRIG